MEDNQNMYLGNSSFEAFSCSGNALVDTKVYYDMFKAAFQEALIEDIQNIDICKYGLCHDNSVDCINSEKGNLLNNEKR